MPSALSIKLRALAAVALAACLGLAAAPPAAAGTYRAAVCHADLGAGHADALFDRNSPHYVPTAACDAGGEGLRVRHDADGSRAGRWGAWSVQAPEGTDISRLSMNAAGQAGGGHVPELLVGPLGGPLAPLAPPSRELAPVTWSGPDAQVFSARLRCRRESGCGSGRTAEVRVKRIVATLRDGVSPTMGIDGSLFAPGSRRGLQTIEPWVADVGGGVRRVLVQVNGEPVTARTVPCELADRIAIRLRPCPPRAEASFDAATAASPFRQGPNLVRVCAADYAPSTAANRACAQRRVRVDNLCPISDLAGGTRLGARLRRSRRGATVSGRLLDADGRGVAGASICIATRIRLPALAERVVATPASDANGRFQARIPDGASREVRVAYWPDAKAAIERYRRLEVRARPRLRVRPRHTLHNGQRARFQARLAGPARSGRRVYLQVRANGRWLNLRGGRTGARGRYRASYRFHATTGRRTYAFRVAVPKQPGYPYEAGRSKVKHKTVIG